MTFNIEEFKNIGSLKHRYEKHIKSLEKEDFETQHIEKAVKQSVQKIAKKIKSFVIYGEPQSGKTELMIALTAKLLDEGHKIIIVLLNDNVGLLEQNLNRFSKSNIKPAPQNYKAALNKNINLLKHESIIFCKKNSSDLKKLIPRVKSSESKVIIDDESDYASPNGKVNREEKTKINELVGNLIGPDGQHIGVTATPARLDLNNTFNNQNTEWVNFPSHSKYTGQDIFFPVGDESVQYERNFLQTGDNPDDLKEALFRFLVHSTYLNKKEKDSKKNYTMLIHTSGKKLDHDRDYNLIIKIIEILKDENHRKYGKYVKSIYNIASNKFKEVAAKNITTIILKNISGVNVLVINSNKDRENLENSTNPSALFTIAIGGNIISRGVTFNNLLSMFFTRSVKGRLQQDTYIQRARMFGNRGSYLKYFDLTIPKKLYADWHTCFVYHKLALESVKSGNVPVWIEGKNTRAVAASSIDKSIIEMNSGEMSFEKFKYDEYIVSAIVNSNESDLDKLNKLQKQLNAQVGNVIPDFLISFIKANGPAGKHNLVVHQSTDISGRGENTDKKNISREKGFIGNSELEKKKYPQAIHHIKILFNKNNDFAKIFYKYTHPLKFLKNPK